MEMDERNFLAEVDKAFYRDGYSLAGQILGEETSPKNILFLTRKVYSLINGLLHSFIERCHRENRRVDCNKGCSICCHQAVMVVPYEAYCLAEYMKENLDEDQCAGIMTRVRAKHKRTGKMRVPEFLRERSACPMLENDQCSVYPARPMACRIYLSYDMGRCKQEYLHPSEKDYFPGLYEFPLRAGRMMNEGICAWLREQNIYPTECLIESALTTISRDPDCISNWLSGKKNFHTRIYSDEEIDFLNRFTDRIAFTGESDRIN